MFSWSIRRKSAPDRHMISPGADVPSPSFSKHNRRRSRSLSSKGSLSSLFSISKREKMQKPLDPAEQSDAAESSMYPPYDTSNPDHNTKDTSPAAREADSTLQRSESKRSAKTPQNWLDSLALKLKAATELFHQDSPAEVEKHRNEFPPPPVRTLRTVRGRSLSPKKSVRFRSQTFSGDSATSTTPINIPSKTAPCLPALSLTRNDMLKEFTNSSEQDPIPTGRPHDTPFLKSQAANNYFFPFPSEIDKKLDDFKSEHVFKALPEPALRPDMLINPFDDSAAIDVLSSFEEGEDKWKDPDKHQANAADRNIPQSKVKPSGRLLDKQVSSAGMKPTKIDDLACKAIAAWNRVSPSKPPDIRVRFDSESNVTNPFIASSETLDLRDGVAAFVPSLAIEASSTFNAPLDGSSCHGASAWDLRSRPERKHCLDSGVDSESDDSGRSVRRYRMLQRRVHEPTHEDIRQKFRMKKPEESGVATADDSGGRLTDKKPSDVGCSPDPIKREAISSNVSSAHRISESNGTESPRVTISPLTTGSRGSQSARRGVQSRAFRFSNTSPGGTSVAEVLPTTFGWEGYKLATANQGSGTDLKDQTPSPVSIPLPLSVKPKRITCGPAKWRDQHGWTPFNEKTFAIRFPLAHDAGQHVILLRPGGFAKFWTELDLPSETAPMDDTKQLSPADLDDVLEYSLSILRRQHFSSSSSEGETFANAATAFSKSGSCYNTTFDAANVNDFSTDSSSPSSNGHSVHCSDKSCQMCKMNPLLHKNRSERDTMTDGLQSSLEFSLSAPEGSLVASDSNGDEEGTVSQVTPTRCGRSIVTEPSSGIGNVNLTPKRGLSRATPMRMTSGGTSTSTTSRGTPARIASGGRGTPTRSASGDSTKRDVLASPRFSRPIRQQ